MSTQVTDFSRGREIHNNPDKFEAICASLASAQKNAAQNIQDNVVPSKSSSGSSVFSASAGTLFSSTFRSADVAERFQKYFDGGQDVDSIKISA